MASSTEIDHAEAKRMAQWELSMCELRESCDSIKHDLARAYLALSEQLEWWIRTAKGRGRLIDHQYAQLRKLGERDSVAWQVRAEAAEARVAELEKAGPRGEAACGRCGWRGYSSVPLECPCCGEKGRVAELEAEVARLNNDVGKQEQRTELATAYAIDLKDIADSARARAEKAEAEAERLRHPRCDCRNHDGAVARAERYESAAGELRKVSERAERYEAALDHIGTDVVHPFGAGCSSTACLCAAKIARAALRDGEP